jgi:hypothetical protein
MPVQSCPKKPVLNSPLWLAASPTCLSCSPRLLANPLHWPLCPTRIHCFWQKMTISITRSGVQNVTVHSYNGLIFKTYIRTYLLQDSYTQQILLSHSTAAEARLKGTVQRDFLPPSFSQMDFSQASYLVFKDFPKLASNSMRCLRFFIDSLQLFIAESRASRLSAFGHSAFGHSASRLSAFSRWILCERENIRGDFIPFYYIHLIKVLWSFKYKTQVNNAIPTKPLS